MPQARAGHFVLLRTIPLVGIIGLLGWFGYREATQARREELRSTLLATLATARLAATTWASHELADARAFARTRGVADAARALASRPPDHVRLLASPARLDLDRLAAGLDRNPGRLGYLVMGPAGVVLAASDTTIVGRPSPRFETAAIEDTLRAGRSAIAVVAAGGGDSALAGRGRLLAAAPILDEDGRALSIFALRLDPVSGLGARADRADPALGQVFFFDRAGRVVGGPAAAPRAHGSGRPDGADLRGYLGIGGTPVVGAWAWIPDLGLGLAAERGLPPALVRIRLTMLAIAALALLGGLLVLSIATSLRQARGLVTLVDDAPIGMLLVDRHGVIRHANAEAARTFGATSPLTDQSVESLLPEAERARHSLLREEFHRHPGMRPMGTGRHLRGVRADGRAVDLEVALSSVALDGRSHVLVMLWDIGPRLAMERALHERTAELARSNHDLEQFAYVASHDLRAPLRGISQLCEWIADELPEDSTAEARRYLGMVRGRVGRLDAMLASILEYARAGHGTRTRERVDPERLVRELVALQHWPDGFRLVVDGALPAFETDANALQQVLHNLLGNAVKHHDRATGTVTVGASDGPPREFRVSDDGPGIPAHLREKAFEMFQTLRPRDEVEGSGMGLTLVRRIVERLGGTVSIDDHAPRGTTIRFTWPDDDGRSPNA